MFQCALDLNMSAVGTSTDALLMCLGQCRQVIEGWLSKISSLKHLYYHYKKNASIRKDELETESQIGGKKS